MCRWIRERWKTLPVIYLTVRGDSHDIVTGFQDGADDYVVKPFDLAVLYSRILALLRRTKTVTDTKLFCDDLMLDKEKTAVYDGQKEIVVSQPEYRLLLILMENKGKTITRNLLLEQVWDCSGNYVNDNTLTVTMKRLREKLNYPACLKTIRSFGVPYGGHTMSKKWKHNILLIFPFVVFCGGHDIYRRFFLAYVLADCI